MYKSFSIRNFRTFNTLSIRNLKRINIIIGKNNTGKTALLEALFLHIGSMNPTLTASITQFRGIPGTKADADSLWGPLFNNYNTEKPIKLVAEYPDRTKATLSISLIPSSLISFDRLESEIPDGRPSVNQLSLLQEKQLQYEYNHLSTSITRTAKITLEGISLDPPLSPNPFPGFLVPARYQFGPRGYAERFGDITVRKLDYLILDALKILEPNIKSLTVIPVGPVPTIHVDIGERRLLPIQLAGEGMARIAEIAIDIASAPKGIVLVDDIDTGIHHTVLPLFWKVIFQLTKRLNAQLFVTTHSAECLETAYSAFSSMKQYDMKVYRLQRMDHAISAISYDKKTLQTAIETGLEVR